MSLSPIQLAYGFNDLYRSLGVLLGFIISPILLLLWMRRSALRFGKMDPVAAWFSYFRVLNWSSNGIHYGSYPGSGHAKVCNTGFVLPLE